MKRGLNFTSATLLSATVAILLGSLVTEAQAQPGKNRGEKFTDVIYFVHDIANKMMNPDGSDKQTIGIEYSGSNLEPSHQTHKDVRWFLRPYGSLTSEELVAIKEDGTTLVLLESGDDADWAVGGGHVRWVSDGTNPDGMVSWGCYRTVEGVQQLAVARTAAVYNAAGELTGIDLSSIEHFLNISPYFDWSPDGTQITFSDQGQLWLYDTVTGTFDMLVDDWVWSSPVWSPDGTRIAYTVNDRDQDVTRIETIDVESRSITLVDKARTQSPIDGTIVIRPAWSPDSSKVAYITGFFSGYQETYSIVHRNADGKGKVVNLTSELKNVSYGVWLLGWRQK